MYVLPSLFSLSLSLSVSVHPVVRSHLTIWTLSALQWLVCSSRRRQSETSSLITLRYYPLDCSDRRWQRLWFPPITFTSLSSFESLHCTAGAADRHTHMHLQQKVTRVSGCLYPLLCVGWQLESTPLSHEVYIYVEKNWFHSPDHAEDEWLNPFDPKIMYSCRWILPADTETILCQELYLNITLVLFVSQWNIHCGCRLCKSLFPSEVNIN